MILMKVHIAQWGNSLALRIPKALADELHLSKDTEVEINLQKDALVITNPAKELEQLIEQITPENLHQETDWGPLTGKEVW